MKGSNFIIFYIYPILWTILWIDMTYIVKAFNFITMKNLESIVHRIQKLKKISLRYSINADNFSM